MPRNVTLSDRSNGWLARLDAKHTDSSGAPQYCGAPYAVFMNKSG